MARLRHNALTRVYLRKLSLKLLLKRNILDDFKKLQARKFSQPVKNIRDRLVPRASGFVFVAGFIAESPYGSDEHPVVAVEVSRDDQAFGSTRGVDGTVGRGGTVDGPTVDPAGSGVDGVGRFGVR